MSDSKKETLEIMKFIFSIVISILIAALGYMMTIKLEAIESQLERMNTALTNQLIINNTMEFRIDDHEGRIEKLEEQK